MNESRTRQSGAVATIVVLFALTLVGVTVFATDMGFVFVRKARLQGIADAAALHGASAVARNDLRSFAAGSFQSAVDANVIAAVTHADNGLSASDIVPLGGNVARVDFWDVIDPGKGHPHLPAVQVGVALSSQTVFGWFGSSANITAYATAVIDYPAATEAFPFTLNQCLLDRARAHGETSVSITSPWSGSIATTTGVGNFAGTTLTVTSLANGPLLKGIVVADGGTPLTPNLYVTAQTAGAEGGTGTYTLSPAQSPNRVGQNFKQECVGGQWSSLTNVGADPSDAQIQGYVRYLNTRDPAYSSPAAPAIGTLVNFASGHKANTYSLLSGDVIGRTYVFAVTNKWDLKSGTNAPTLVIEFACITITAISSDVISGTITSGCVASGGKGGGNYTGVAMPPALGN